MSANRKGILVVGAADDTARIRGWLTGTGTAGYEVVEAASLAGAVEQRAARDFDLAFVHLPLAGARASDVIELLQKAAPTLPVVVLVDATSAALGEAAVKAGARDYLIRDRLEQDVLDRYVPQTIELQGLQVELTLTDPLTGLYNRRGFTAVAEQYLKLARRLQHSLVLTHLDVDDLEKINRDLGRAKGDWALQQVAALLRLTFRESDLMARLTDDDFVFFAMGATDRSAEALAARLSEALRRVTESEGHALAITLSAGVVWFDPEGGLSLSELMTQAAAAMREQQERKKAG